MSNPAELEFNSQSDLVRPPSTASRKSILVDMKDFFCHKLVLDFILLILLGTGVILFKTVGSPYMRGFYCDDETIRYPYKGSTISTGVLLAVAFAVPTFTIFLFETVRLRVENQGTFGFEIPRVVYRLGGRKVHRFLVRIYVFMGYYFAGAAMCQMLTDIGKYSIGRMRPHFIDVCNPDWAKINCTGSGGLNNEKYITDPSLCLGNPDLGDRHHQEYLMRESRLSFPSGHASFSFYTAVYTLFYMEARIPYVLYRPLLRPALQFFYIALALTCSYSRISDYKHHWSDVLSGAVLGSVVGIIVAFHVAKLFKRQELPETWVKVDSLHPRTDLIQLSYASRLAQRAQSAEQLDEVHHHRSAQHNAPYATAEKL